MPFYSSGFSPYFPGGYPGMGYPGMGYGGYPYNPAMYNSSFNYSGPVTYPGFASMGYGARKRSTIYPALAIAPEAATGNGPIRAASYETDSSRAHIEVTVPRADAQVWIQGTLMQQTGTTRQFVSPPLAADSKYTYEVRVRWGEHTETKQVPVRAGARVTLNFTDR
jgi:uncharacterized protein (TIGR03000 family)